MNIFVACLIFGCLGAALGVFVANWARELPPPLPDHTDCDARFERMSKRLRQQIHEKEEIIVDLLRGQS